MPSAAPPEQRTCETTFDFSQGVVLLDVDLGAKRPAHLVLDTGNNHCVLDTEAARELGIPLDDSARKTAGSGADAVTYYKIAPSRFRLAETDLPAKFVLVMPSRKSFEESGVKCDGTLGYDCLKNLVVQVDYPMRQLRLLNAADTRAAEARGSASAIAWKKYHSRSPDLVTVENLRIGEHALCAQIDTFFPRTAILFSTKLPWLQTQPAPGIMSARYEEAELAAIRVAGGLALGNTRLAASEPVFLAGPNAHIPETDIAAVLGSGFFASCVLTLDFPATRIILETPPR